MLDSRGRLIARFLAFVFAMALWSPANAAVNLEWRPAHQAVSVGDEIKVALYAVSDDETDQSISALSIILLWDPSRLELLDKIDDGPYAWEPSRFPDDSGLDGLNAPFSGPEPFVPANDGDAFYNCLGRTPGPPAYATPGGLLVTTLKFRALCAGPAELEIPSTFGQFTRTRVVHGEFPGVDVTGALGPPATFQVCAVIATLLVDADATGADDGTSWDDAFTDLQAALAAVPPEACGVQIWVAEGTYTPAGAGGDRAATFQLVNDVAIYGGFAGGETNLVERDPAARLAVLSGDLNRDDDAGGDNSENSYHVVTGSGTVETAILDGFVIARGNADDGAFPGNTGGGMLNRQSRSYSPSGSPTVVNCVFVGHAAVEFGGAVFNTQDARPTFINCAFSGNTAAVGGAIYNFDSSPSLTNCTLSGNWADDHGGIQNAGPIGSHPTLTNCVLWGNEDEGGADESAQLGVNGVSTVLINYSCVQGLTGGFGGTGNIGDDPLLTDSDGVDDILGTLDDCLRLALGSPGNDAGDNGAVPASVTTDLGGNPRFLEDPNAPDVGNGTAPIVDMGAYEQFEDCNGNNVPDGIDIRDCPPGDPGCQDCNGNNVPDECDIAQGTSEDCNDNGIPDECDGGCEPPDDGGDDDGGDDGGGGGGSGGGGGETVEPGPSELDSDNDGVNDCDDQCPDTPEGEEVDKLGCSSSQRARPADGDPDDDGVGDADDQCPGTPPGETVDAAGCSCSQLDSDRDGVNDCIDQCPGEPDNDTDGDGIADCNDNCVDVVNTGQLDSDGDGVGDACDLCPDDFDPTNADADGDGVGDACEEVTTPIDGPEPEREEPLVNEADGVAAPCGMCGSGIPMITLPLTLLLWMGQRRASHRRRW